MKTIHVAMAREFPLVSIIIPVFNAEPFLAATLESCLNQSYKHLEIVVVNDGSTDGSGNVVQSFCDPRIRYFKTGNRGACEARNFGISQAQGELFQFLDHDDLLDQSKIEVQVKCYLTHGPDWVYSGDMGSVSGDQRGADTGYQLYQKDFSPQAYFDTVLSQFDKHVTTGAWLLPRERVEATRGWDAHAGLNDDGEYFMRVILNSKGIRYCKGSLFCFRRDVPHSLSKRRENDEVFAKWLYSYQSYVEEFNQHLTTESARALSWKALSVFYCNSYPHVPKLRAQCLAQIRALGYRSAYPTGGYLLVKTARFIGIDAALRLWKLKQDLCKVVSKRH